MHDAHWCQSNVDRLNDHLATLAASLAGMSRLLDDAQAAWQDRAGRDVSTRSLRPFEEASRQFRGFLDLQSQQLGASVADMLSAVDPTRRSRDAMDLARLCRDQCHQESLHCHHQADISLEHQAASATHTQNATALLSSIR